MPIGIILTVHTALIAHTVRTALTVRTIQVDSKTEKQTRIQLRV